MHDEELGSSMKNNPILPPDLIREILLTLPVRSVLRFKCVCKLWLSLISDPEFSISHFDLIAAPSHRILTQSNDHYIESVDIESQLSKDSNAVHLRLPPPSPPPYPYQYNGYDHAHLKPEILGSCRGLILLYYDRSNDIILWNPSTGVHKQVPHVKYYELTREFFYGFGYDALNDDYLIILIESSRAYLRTETKIHIFSFKSYSWFIEDIDVSYIGPYEFRAGVLLNGALHWIAFFKDKIVPFIIVFDLIQRSFSEIHLLDNFTVKKYDVFRLSLGVMEGYLSVCCSVHGCTRTEIWVMKEYKVQSSWTKSIVTPNRGFSLICNTKDGGILGSSSFGRLEKLNGKGELLEDLSFCRDGQLYSANLRSALYRESLLSLPNVIEETSEDNQLLHTRKIWATV